MNDVPGVIFGQSLAEGLPLVGSALATLVAIWSVLNCIASPLGAALGSVLARSRAAGQAERTRRAGAKGVEGNRRRATARSHRAHATWAAPAAIAS